ncbi:MAG: hypothetical protein Q9217_001230, partial [Psora testacea]
MPSEDEPELGVERIVWLEQGKKVLEEKLQKQTEELDCYRRQGDVISQLEEDNAALEVKLREKSQELDGEQRERNVKEKALEDRILEVELVTHTLQDEKQRVLDESREKLMKKNTEVSKQLEDYKHLYATLQAEHSDLMKFKATATQQKKIIDQFRNGKYDYGKLLLRGQETELPTPTLAIEQFTDSLGSQIAGLREEIARLETELNEERRNHEQSRQILDQSQERIRGLEVELDQSELYVQELDEQRQHEVEDLRIKCRAIDQSCRARLRNAGILIDDQPRTPEGGLKKRTRRRLRKGRSEQNTAADTESIPGGMDNMAHSTPDGVEEYINTFSEDAEEPDRTAHALKKELGSQHNSDAISLSSIHAQDDDTTIRCSPAIGRFAPPQSPHDSTITQVFEVANIQPNLKSYKDAATESEESAPPAINTPVTQANDPPKTCMTYKDAATHAEKSAMPAMNTQSTQTDDPHKTRMIYKDAATQTKKTKMRTIGTQVTPTDDRPETGKIYKNAATQAKKTKMRAIGTQVTLIGDRPKTKTVGLQTDPPPETKAVGCQTNARNTDAQSQTPTITYATAAVQTPATPAPKQATFYTDLKSWGSSILTRKLITALYILIFLACLTVVILSVRYQMMALKERNMWLQANDVSRRATVYIRHANSNGLRVGWLWEEKLLQLEDTPLGFAEKYRRYGA